MLLAVSRLVEFDTMVEVATSKDSISGWYPVLGVRRAGLQESQFRASVQDVHVKSSDRPHPSEPFSKVLVIILLPSSASGLRLNR